MYRKRQQFSKIRYALTNISLSALHQKKEDNGFVPCSFFLLFCLQFVRKMHVFILKLIQWNFHIEVMWDEKISANANCRM